MFKALIEREADTQIKILCTDHGGEFNSQELYNCQYFTKPSTKV